jgi:hypothetical protein
MKRLVALVGLLFPLTTGCGGSITVGADPSVAGIPRCSAATTQGRGESRSALLLMAQSVRTASLLPCIRALPVGWTFAKLDVTSKRAQFWLASDRAGKKALRVSVSRACNTEGASASASERADVRRYNRVQPVSSGFRADHYFVFPGGCIRYHFDLHRPGGAEELRNMSTELDFVSRADLARSVHDYSDGRFELDPTGAEKGPR